MSRSKILQMPLGLVLVVAFATFFISPTTSAEAQQPAPAVEVAKPLSREIVEWDEYTGQFQPVQTVEIQARVSGYIKSVEFEEGSLVKKGDLLFEIDARPFEAELSQARAQLQVAEAQRDLAKLNNERAAELLSRRVGTQANADDAFAQLAQAEANVTLAQAQIEEAELNLEFTRITAPISGRISATNLDVGNLVSGTTASEPLANIVSLDPIEFTFTASEAAYLKYARLARDGGRPSSRETGNEVRVKLADEDNWDRTGFMSFVDNRLDPNSGTIEGRALFENGDLFLQPGIYGRMRLIGSRPYQALLIPDEAILSDQSSKIVYVIDAENKAAGRKVSLGPMHGGLRIIRDGLSPDERVVVRGTQRVRDGAQVSPTEVEPQLDENAS